MKNIIKLNEKKAELSDTTVRIILILILIFIGLYLIGEKILLFKSSLI